MAKTEMVVLIGHYKRDDMLLQVLSEKNNLNNVYGYQIIETKRGKCCIRKLDPKLKELNPEEALQAADRIIVLEPPGETIRTLIQNRKAVSILDIVESNPVDTPSSLNIEIDESWFPDILQIIGDIALTGYQFRLGSPDPELDQLLALTRYRSHDTPLEISLRCRPGPTVPMEIIRRNIIDFLRDHTDDITYYTFITDQYHLQWKKNLHWLERGKGVHKNDAAGGKLFLSCSRSVRVVSVQQRRILSAMHTHSIHKLSNFPREEVESVAAMCGWESRMVERICALLDTGLARIENMDDVIVSILGSRRCNLNCEYCFSDHTCAALSTMSANDVLELTDMLTADRPGLNLHADNNLGGEPWEDLPAVKTRHNALLAYHKTRGCRASFGLLTNGTLMKKDDLPWFRHHIPYLGFSLDGDKATHDRIRLDAAKKPTYDRTVRGIQLLQDADWPVPTGVSCVISKYNLNIAGLHKHIRDKLNIPNIVMKPVRAAAESDFALTYGDLEELMERYQDFFDYLLNEGKKENLQPLFTMLQPLDYAGRFFIRVFLNDRLIVKRCGSGEHIFSVGDDGNVYPCDSFNGVESVEIGNINEGMHNRFHYRVPFVHEEQEEFGCGSCWARFLCGGICSYVKHVNQYECNDVTRMECGLAKFLIESAIRFWEVARENWSVDSLERTAVQIRNIGFASMPDKDAFVYAPC